ncbi:MAG: hypothetical protein VCE91_00020, partial [Nitrospinota bacterium]
RSMVNERIFDTHSVRPPNLGGQVTRSGDRKFISEGHKIRNIRRVFFDHWSFSPTQKSETLFRLLIMDHTTMDDKVLKNINNMQTHHKATHTFDC